MVVALWLHSRPSVFCVSRHRRVLSYTLPLQLFLTVITLVRGRKHQPIAVINVQCQLKYSSPSIQHSLLFTVDTVPKVETKTPTITSTVVYSYFTLSTPGRSRNTAVLPKKWFQLFLLLLLLPQVEAGASLVLRNLTVKNEGWVLSLIHI